MRSAAFPVHRHSLLQLLVDGLLVALAYFLAFRLRFPSGFGGANARYEHLLTDTIWWVVPLTVVVLAAFGVYQRLWTFIGQRDYEAVIKAVVVSTLIVVGVITIAHPVSRPVVTVPGVLHSRPAQFGTAAVEMPASVIALFLLLELAMLVAARFLVHLFTEGRVRSIGATRNAQDVLIVGAGDGGRLVVRELMRNPQLRQRPVGFLDDDPRKQGSKDPEHGLRVLGTTSTADLERVLDEVEPKEVVIAIPSAPGTLRARVWAACRERGIVPRTLPTVFELLRDGSGQMHVARQLREMRVEDMLGREPVLMELERVGAYLTNQVVLVTGAGGSIGAELCRQIARVGPQRLILVDHAEDNLFEIMRELEEDRHVRTAVPVLADCKEEERMREVLSEHKPTVIFHAAAYKHVTMMELNPVEAIRNNALATQLMARIAGEAGVGTFVLVSTDKAVKPATVMGASKALAEWAVEAAARKYPQTTYSTVRFGNVLGSSGSVVPIFRRQIAAGGPVTVTDKRMSRYFMTIPEAVQLIIRAGSLSDAASGADGERPGVRARDGRPDQDRRPRRDDDPPVGSGARARHRDRDRRRAPRREVPRGPVQPLRAAAADGRSEDRSRRARAARSCMGRAYVRRNQPAGAGGRRRSAGRAGLQAVPRPRRAGRRALAPGSPRRLRARE